MSMPKKQRCMTNFKGGGSHNAKPCPHTLTIASVPLMIHRQIDYSGCGKTRHGIVPQVMLGLSAHLAVVLAALFTHKSSAIRGTATKTVLDVIDKPKYKKLYLQP